MIVAQEADNDNRIKTKSDAASPGLKSVSAVWNQACRSPCHHFITINQQLSARSTSLSTPISSGFSPLCVDVTVYLIRAPQSCKLIICLPPLAPSAGLPHRLPDSVCPAAVLQHVLRPPQQLRETNSAINRPLARPAAFPTHSCSPFSCALPSVDPPFLLSW